MYYESEEHYNEAMSAQAEAEYDQYRQYQEYLAGLIENKQYEVFGIEICLDFLMSKDYVESGLTPQQYLTYKKEKLLHPDKPISDQSKELEF